MNASASGGLTRIAGMVAVGLLACTAPPPGGPRSHQIDIRGLEFLPSEITVAAGDTLIWHNHDIVPHTVTLEATRNGRDEIAAGQEVTLVVTDTGTYRYECRYHPTMIGRLTVR